MTSAVVTSPLPERRSLVWLYLAGAASAGLILCLWTARTVRTAGADTAIRGFPKLAGLGAAIPFVQAALLYDLAYASAERRGLAPDRHALIPACASLLLASTLAIGPLDGLWALWWVLAPVPFLFVQGSINRETRSTRTPLGYGRIAGLGTIAALGTVAIAAVAWLVDIPALRLLATGPLREGQLVAGESGLYRIAAPDGRWHQVEQGTVSEDPSDLELMAENANSWLVSYVHPARDYNLNDVVDNRRALVREAHALESIEERRSFESGLEFVPVSIAEYLPKPSALVHERYVVYTARLDDQVIEIVTYSSGTDAEREGLDGLVSGVRLEPDLSESFQ